MAVFERLMQNPINLNLAPQIHHTYVQAKHCHSRSASTVITIEHKWPSLCSRTSCDLVIPANNCWLKRRNPATEAQLTHDQQVRNEAAAQQSKRKPEQEAAAAAPKRKPGRPKPMSTSCVYYPIHSHCSNINSNKNAVHDK